MASSSIQRASSSSTSIPQWKYDVFLNFRGEDTRENFTDHLYTALIERGIHTFRDDEEIERGSKITPKLLKAIEESRFCMVVFSKSYAHSRWCLEELVKIIECVKENGQTIIPIFYHVDPSDVRRQKGSFAEAFVNLERQNEKKAKRWRAALRKASKISGWHIKNGYESVFIKKITNDICKRLNCKILHVGENIVGMDFHLDNLKSLINITLNEVRMIGIYGIGGIGKTTIAKVVCNSISYQFDGSSFLEDVRKTGNYCGVLQLQQKLLQDILRGRDMKLHNIDEGINVIKDRLRSKKVLVVVDDVDNLCQLEYIVGKHDWFCPGSRIIITTRDKHLLDVHGVDETYEVKELNYEESIELFSRYAFKQSLPKDDYKNLLNRAIDYAKGLPLALKVLGIFLFSKTIPEWESSLCKLERKLHMDIQSVLKISFDGLDDVEKEIFLDIACFFKGKDKDFVSRILDGCNFYVESGIRVLVDKCLLNVSNNKLDMHDLLQHMGWEIVRGQCLKEPGRRSRLWEGEDIYHVLTRNTGTKEIEGIILDMSTSKQIQFSTKAFKRMKRLRLLKVHQDAQYDSIVKYCKDVHIPKGHLPEDFTFPSYDLRYLHWDGYPLKSLPLCFHVENLVELSLQSSGIEKLWDKKVFEKLKVLNVSYSKHLIEIPDFSNMPNVEILIVKGCENLMNLPGGIHKLNHLNTLCCTGCSNLKSFPEIMDMMENLRELYLGRTGIKTLPWSIERLEGVQYLDLAHCENLESLPESICNLRSLKTLLVNNCSKLSKFPDTLRSFRIVSDWTQKRGFGEMLGEDEKFVRLPTSKRLRCSHSMRHSGPAFLQPWSPKPEFLQVGNLEPEFPQVGNLEPEFPQPLNLEPEFPQVVNEEPELLQLRNLEPGFPQQGNLEPGFPQQGNLEPEFPQVGIEGPELLQLGNLGPEFPQVGIEEPELLQLGNLEPEIPQQGIEEPGLLQPGNLEPKFLQPGSPQPESSKPESAPKGPPKRYREDQMEKAIRSDNWSLCWLEELDLSYCNLKEGGIAREVFHLPPLQVLNLSGNNFCKIPPNIGKCSKLRILKMSHCKLLLEIPELPSSLREIDAHGCPLLLPLLRQTQLLHSLLNCFKSDIQDFECGFGSSDRFMPGSLYDGKGISLFIDGSSGFPEWIKHQNMGNEVVIQLPLNWYEDNDLLGFSLFAFHVPVNGFEEKAEGEDPSPCSLKCELAFLGGQFGIVDDLFLDSFCGCYNNGGVSDQVWVTYYPKVAVKEMYHSNNYRILKASFCGTHFKVEKCGINLIYAKDDGLNHPTMFRDPPGYFGDDGSSAESTIHNIKSRSDDAEQNSAKEHSHKKLRRSSPDPNLSSQLHQQFIGLN